MFISGLEIGGPVSLIYGHNGCRKYLTRQERSAFLETSHNTTPSIATFCNVLAYTGARISEVLELTSTRIDVDEYNITFESLKKRKKGVFRTVPVPAELIHMLDTEHNLRMSKHIIPSGTIRLTYHA